MGQLTRSAAISGRHEDLRIARRQFARAIEFIARGLIDQGGRRPLGAARLVGHADVHLRFGGGHEHGEGDPAPVRRPAQISGAAGQLGQSGAAAVIDPDLFQKAFAVLVGDEHDLAGVGRPAR